MALDRSILAITAGVSSPPKKKALANNPYHLLADQEDSEVCPPDSTSMEQAHEREIGELSVNEADLVPTRGAQYTPRKIRSLKRALADNSMRAEIEEVLGKDSLAPKSREKELASSLENNPQLESDTQEDNELAGGKNSEKPQTDSDSPVISHGNNTAVNPEHPIAQTRNVSFKDATKNPTTNSHVPRQGNLLGSMTGVTRRTPANPYTKSGEESHVRQPQVAKLDKAITLKKNLTRSHIHRYTLRLKTIQAKSEDEAHQLLKDSLQRFLEIVLQADSKTIVPPYLELDRNDKSVTDISSVFPVSSLDSYHTIKKYFFRLSPRDEAGISWCSIILAQSMPFAQFMDKAKYSLENNDFALWPKASDNENTTDAGWLLYSTRAQDEERISVLLSELTGENLGVKWKPIRARSGYIKKKEQQEDA